jgi:hypothetical protein
MTIHDNCTNISTLCGKFSALGRLVPVGSPVVTPYKVGSTASTTHLST